MSMSQGTQHKLSRVRAPRVHIQYDVETGGALELRELPFVVGVLANLSGKPDPKAPLPRLRDRKFVEIDRDNFDAVLAAAKPRLKLNVENTLEKDGSRLGVEVQFTRIEDFEPEQVARKIPELRMLLEARDRLADLLNRMEGSPTLEDVLREVIQNTDKLKRLSDETRGGGGPTGQEGSAS